MFRTSFYREEILKKNFKTSFTETKKTFKEKKAVRNSPGSDFRVENIYMVFYHSYVLSTGQLTHSNALQAPSVSVLFPISFFII